MSRKIYSRLSFMAVSWLDESTLEHTRRVQLFVCYPCYTFALITASETLKNPQSFRSFSV
jgi:hypothetical protein